MHPIARNNLGVHIGLGVKLGCSKSLFERPHLALYKIHTPQDPAETEQPSLPRLYSETCWLE